MEIKNQKGDVIFETTEPVLAYRKRHKITMGKGQETCHIIKTRSRITFVWAERPHVVHRAEFDNNHPWFYPIKEN